MGSYAVGHSTAIAVLVPGPLSPDRELVFPFSIAFFPMIWFVFRDAGVRVVDGQQVTTPLSRTLTLAVVAVIASYLIAVVVAAIGTRDRPAGPWRRLLFRPTTGTLRTFVVLWSAIVAYIALGATVALPFWSELVVGIPLLWPLLVALLLSFAVGNAFPVLQAFEVQVAITVFGLLLSATWLVVLSTGIARLLAGE